MKLLFLVAKAKLRQVSSPDDAACLRFLEGRDCHLFKFDTVSTEIDEIAIPSIDFTEGCIGDR